MINRYGRWLDVNHVFPKNINECYVRFDYFLECDYYDIGVDDVSVGVDHDLHDGYFVNLDKLRDGNEIAFVRNSILASNAVQFEDCVICESVQRGISSSAYERVRGRYAPAFEEPLLYFHHLYANDMCF